MKIAFTMTVYVKGIAVQRYRLTNRMRQRSFEESRTSAILDGLKGVVQKSAMNKQCNGVARNMKINIVRNSNKIKEPVYVPHPPVICTTAHIPQ